LTETRDVVVVGAGLGGLACAADLANRGASVLVLERHSLVGGYASSFERGPFTFDVSQHSVGGLRPGGSFHTLLERLEVAGEVELAFPETLATLVSGEETLALPNDAEGCREALAALAPQEADALGAFLETCVSIHRDTVAGALDNDMRKLVRGMRLAGNRTFGQALGEAISSERLRAALAVPWVLLGLPPSRASFSWFAKVLATTYVEGTAQILGGGQALSDALAARIRAQGGEVRTGCAAMSILTEGGRTRAVTTQDDDTIDARTVVAAVDPWTVAELLGDEETGIEPSGEPSLSMFALYMGLGRKPASLGMPDGAVFIGGAADAEGAYRASLKGELEETDIVLSNPTSIDPGSAPGDKGMVHAVGLVNGRPWFDLEGAAYLKRKRRATEALAERLERLYPGLGAAVEVQEAATPRTMHGYTRNHLGAVYGLAQTPGQSGARRPAATTPVSGLFRTGAWVLPGGGYSAATLSGLMTGRDVARHLGLDGEARSAAPRRGRGTFQLSVFYEDTDTDGVTYHVSYLRFFDRARTEMFMQIAKERDLSLPRAVVSRIEVSYHRPSTLADMIEIRTRGRFESDFRVVFEQEALLEADGSQLAEAVTEMAFVDPDGNPIPCPIREELEKD
jgi:YbgC/YbaW family acyl-CoA thioester hydrolase